MTSFPVSGTLGGYSSIPTLQYQDDSGNWAALPSGAVVTTTTFTFTHPNILATGSHIVSVRDANAITVVGASPTFTVTGFGESANNTTVTTVGPTISDSVGDLWSITSGAQVARNGVADGTTASVIELAYVNHVVYQENAALNWYSWSGSTWVGPVTSPLAPPAGGSPSGTTVKAFFGGSITDGAAAVWTITSGRQVAINGAADASTSGVLMLAYVNGVVFHQNIDGTWFSRTGNTWAAVGVIPPIAMRTFDMIDTIGVNTHLLEGSPGWSNNTVVQNSLVYLGIKNLRDGFIQSDTLAFLTQLNTAVGGGLHFYVNTLHYTGAVGGFALSDFVNNAATAENQIPGLIYALEGPNEVDVASFSYGGLTGIAAGNKQQADLYAAVKANNTLKNKPVAMWALANPSNAGAVGNQGANADFGTVHDYTFGGLGGTVISYDVSFINQSKTNAPGKNIIDSESGYFTNTIDASGWGVSEVVQGKLYMIQLFNHVWQGFWKNYFYEMMNTDTLSGSGDSQSNYGIFRSDGTAKSAATYIHNLVIIMKDAGGTATTFLPGSLPYSTTGLPATAKTYLFQKSNGAFDIVLWNDVSLWNTGTPGSAKTISSTSVTVNFSKSFATVKTFDPTVGTATTSSAANLSSLSVGLSDHPIIIELL